MDHPPASASASAPASALVYISNLPFSLTNNDLHKVFEQHGRIVKVTILKDAQRRSKGVAFIQYLKTSDAQTCLSAVNLTEMFGRTIRASIAADNGRNAEFSRKRTYENKQRCYECGAEGHLSYKCPENVLGERKPPVKRSSQKPSSRKPSGARHAVQSHQHAASSNSYASDDEEVQVPASGHQNAEARPATKKPRFKQNAYFSDDEDVLSD